MAHCVHHVPGRARFKIPQLRTNPMLAAEIQETIVAVDGIVHVEVNRHASSVIIHYDIETSPLEDVVEHMRASAPATVPTGTVPPSKDAHGHSAPHGAASLPRSVGQVFGQAVFATLVQRTLERSLLSILTGRLR